MNLNEKTTVASDCRMNLRAYDFLDQRSRIHIDVLIDFLTDEKNKGYDELTFEANRDFNKVIGLTIIPVRMETDGEWRSRIDRVKEGKAADMKKEQEEEYKQYLKLKKKYEHDIRRT